MATRQVARIKFGSYVSVHSVLPPSRAVSNSRSFLPSHSFPATRSLPLSLSRARRQHAHSGVLRGSPPSHPPRSLAPSRARSQRSRAFFGSPARSRAARSIKVLPAGNRSPSPSSGPLALSFKRRIRRREFHGGTSLPRFPFLQSSASFGRPVLPASISPLRSHPSTPAKHFEASRTRDERSITDTRHVTVIIVTTRYSTRCAPIGRHHRRPVIIATSPVRRLLPPTRDPLLADRARRIASPASRVRGGRSIAGPFSPFVIRERV